MEPKQSECSPAKLPAGRGMITELLKVNLRSSWISGMKRNHKRGKKPKNTEKHGTAWKVQGCTARDGLRKPRVTDSNPYFLSSPYYWMAMMMAIMISTKRKLLPILEDLF